MIRADKNETFVVTAALIDEGTGNFVSGEDVVYDVRNAEDDSELSPTISGTMTESSVKQGIYRTTMSIPNEGAYICYTSCSDFLTGTEDLIINPENLYELTKQNRNYNIFVEDVVRTTVSGNYGQNIRKVPQGATDYISTKIKSDDSVDWSGPSTISGAMWAWYRDTSASLPYKMGSEF